MPTMMTIQLRLQQSIRQRRLTEQTRSTRLFSLQAIVVFTTVLLLLILILPLESFSLQPVSRSHGSTSRYQACLTIPHRITLLKPPSKEENKQQQTPPPSRTTSSLSLLLSGAEEATIISTATTITDEFWQNTNVWIFIAGVFPFAWATVEFWRRVIMGESFGTGKDSVVIIGKDDAPKQSRGRRVLGRDALITAYILFIVAFGTIGIVLYSVLSSAPPPLDFPQSSSSSLSPSSF